MSLQIKKVLELPRWDSLRFSWAVMSDLHRQVSSKRRKKISQADQSAAPTEEHHGGNGTRLAQEDTTDTFLSPSNGTHPAGPGPPKTDRHILGTVSNSFLI